MLDKETLRIIEANKPYKKMLEEYDNTKKFALDKIRRSFTIKEKTHQKLKQEAQKKDTTMSHLIDELVEDQI